MELLINYYAIANIQRVNRNEETYFVNNDSLYLIIPVVNKEAIYMEQIVLSYFLKDNGFEYVAHPIRNKTGEWITAFQGNKYIVLQAPKRENSNVVDDPYSEGIQLATFHVNNRNYPYEPQEISSYGKWHRLWIDKLTTFEQLIENRIKKQHNSYTELLLDSLPYLIGLSENAIQYVQEAEEAPFDTSDQGSITFVRYDRHSFIPFIRAEQLAYDHAMRDVAERIRYHFLYDQEAPLPRAQKFLNGYQSVQPLSPFSYRLLYARLLYPVHLFDMISDTWTNDDISGSVNKVQSLLNKQSNYEKNMKNLHDWIVQNDNNLQIPMLHWM